MSSISRYVFPVKRKRKLDIIIDVETIGVFRPGYVPSRAVKPVILAEMNGQKISKKQKEERDSKMIISNAIFNVGITVQHKGKILESEQYGINEFWEYPEHRILDFYRKNFSKDGSEFTERYDTFGEFLKKVFYPMLSYYGKHNEIALWSYNADFDRRAFIDTAKLENMYIPEPILNKWNCIMILACNALLSDNGKKYLNWITEQEYCIKGRPKEFRCEYISEGRNARTKAETLYRYISGNIEFIEAHKGMQDTQIEGEILEWCKKKKNWKDLDKTPKGGGWQVFNHRAFPWQKRGTFDDEKNIGLLSPINQERLSEIMDLRGE